MAATAVTHGLTLVTADAPVFAGVPGLQLTDWFVP
jgi:predicted nucleic acid-binding protein